MDWFVLAIVIYMFVQFAGPLILKRLLSGQDNDRHEDSSNAAKTDESVTPARVKKQLLRLLQARAKALGEERYKAPDRYAKPRAVVKTRKSDVKVRAGWFR